MNDTPEDIEKKRKFLEECDHIYRDTREKMRKHDPSLPPPVNHEEDIEYFRKNLFDALKIPEELRGRYPLPISIDLLRPTDEPGIYERVHEVWMFSGNESRRQLCRYDPTEQRFKMVRRLCHDAIEDGSERLMPEERVMISPEDFMAETFVQVSGPPVTDWNEIKGVGRAITPAERLLAWFSAHTYGTSGPGPTAPPELKCVCGSDSLGSPRHSPYCGKYRT